MTDVEDEIVENLLEYVGCNNIDTEIEVGNMIVNIRGSIRTYGYMEDDFHCGYMNGTGYNVTTSADIQLTFDVTTYDDDGNEVDNDIEIDEDAIRECLYNEIID